MILGRIFGWLVLCMALMAGATELAARIKEDVHHLLTFGELWQNIHPGTFASIQIWIEWDEFLGLPWLWDPIFTIFLGLPAWPALTITSTILLYVFRRR